MALTSSVNDQITDAVTQAHEVGGEEAVSIISDLLNNIAQGLNGAKKGHTSLEELSDAFENAEVALHDIVAKLATSKD
jgi:hypothetical protein